MPRCLLRHQPRDRFGSTAFLVRRLSAGDLRQRIRAICALIKPNSNPVMWERRRVFFHVQPAEAKSVWLTLKNVCSNAFTG